VLEELERLKGVVGEEHEEALGALESAIRAHVVASEEQAGLMATVVTRAETAEADVRERDGRLEAAAAEIARVRADLAATLEVYRSAVRAQVPGAPGLIQGETVEAINASLEQAKDMVARIEAMPPDLDAFPLQHFYAVTKPTRGTTRTAASDRTSELPHRGHQLDTSVLAAHRGHRLGLLLKISMLRWLAEEEPQLQFLDTWNAVSNDHMISVNEALGYEPIATASVFQRSL